MSGVRKDLYEIMKGRYVFTARHLFLRFPTNAALVTVLLVGFNIIIEVGMPYPVLFLLILLGVIWNVSFAISLYVFDKIVEVEK